MNRSLKLSMLIALALGSTQVMALDLGQVQVKSTLGQPLLAEIPLHAANPAELQNLVVQLASSEDFVRAGIAGGRTSIPLHFSVAGSGSGERVIRITSSVAVDDPFLDLLIEVNGKAGKSVREFTILLDPPGTVAAPAAAMASAAAYSAPTEAVATAVAPTTPTAPTAPPRQAHAAAAAPATTRAAAVSSAQYGPVARGQTLSAIARTASPAGVDVHQMLLALKQANPDAFYRDNINALKTGAVLRVPTASEAQNMAVAAAIAEVSRQNSDWRAGTTVKPATVADAATRASASSAPSSTSRSAGDRLALVPAKDGNGAQAHGAGSADNGGKSAASIHQDLLRTQESIASLQQQGTDLKTRLTDLADINSKNEHLLSLKDNQIAELQAKLAAAGQATGVPVTVPAAAASASTAKGTAETAMTTAQPLRPSSPATAGTTAKLAPTAVASRMTTPAAAASAPVAAVNRPGAVESAVTRTPAPAVGQPWYMRAWAWAAGAAAVVVLLLLAMLGRRRETVAPLPKSSPLAHRFGSTSPFMDHDIVASDDIDQEELLDQLAEHPDDIGLHLELVTLYYSRRDIEHFEGAAEAMHAHVVDPQQDEWQDVMHMGEDLVPGHPLFDHHAVLPMHDESDTRREFDIDDYSASGDLPTVGTSLPPLPPQVPKKVSEYAFNVDPTSPLAGKGASSDSVVAPPVADTHEVTSALPEQPALRWQFDEHEGDHLLGGDGHGLGEFSDDPIDTKLDLARAYLDMGDADSASAMLGEVLNEGSQMQQDAAKRLLETLH
jgi:pilus assembly protein FimV